MQYVLFAAGLLVGAVIVWLFLRGKIALAEAKGFATGEVERASLAEKLGAATRRLQETETLLDETAAELGNERTKLSSAERECAQLGERAKMLQQRLGEVEEENRHRSERCAALTEKEGGYNSMISELRTKLDAEQRQSQEKLDLLAKAREELSNQFKALANEILDDKAKKFTEQNQSNLGQLLNPLKEKITAFQAKVEEVYINEGKDRSALGEQVRLLTQLNATLSHDAQNLTLALKGDRKALGDLGEIILEDVLEKAGLVRGQHYEVQESEKREDGSRLIPDVVVHLPGERNIVIDSKMTLPDYRAFASADDEEERVAALGRYLKSIRAHIKGLSAKEYQKLYGLKSLDFVIMFVPVEPAFMVAVTNDRELFQEGWQKNVLLVSPSTLLFVIRTVANLWRQEDISRNAQDISNRGAELYDKLVSFVDDLQHVGNRLKQAQESYDDARKKLCEGRGNALRQAEMLRELGVKPSKCLPSAWVEAQVEKVLPSLAPETERDVLAPDSHQGSELQPIKNREG